MLILITQNEKNKVNRIKLFSGTNCRETKLSGFDLRRKNESQFHATLRCINENVLQSCSLFSLLL